MPFVQKTVYTEPTHDYHNYGCKIRGDVLHYVAEMERMIDDYICSHFCYNLKKRAELMEIIVSSRFLNFRSKVDLFKHLLLKRKDVNETTAIKIHEILSKKIAPKRNMLAHATLDSSITSIKKWKRDPTTVYFTRYDYTKKTESFGKNDFLILLDPCTAVKSYLMELKGKRIKKMIKRNKGRNPLWPAKQTKLRGNALT